MIDFTWKLFSKTGNIEAYLLLKELEKTKQISDLAQGNNEEKSKIDTNM